MSEVIFQNKPMLMLLPLVAVFLVVFRVRMIRRKQDMEAFGENAVWRGSEHRSMEPWRLVLLVVSSVLIILALARPAANPHPRMLQREGRDVVFLLDVSKSMLAEDRLPNRLESAKIAIGECANDLQDHRLGLVVFAGSSSIACPLTLDKEFFLKSLEQAGPDSVAHGGTRVGDALLKVCDKLFSDSDQGYKDIVLLTDGGDHSPSLEKALELVNEKQVKLIAIGLGDEKQGARIPQTGESSEEKSDYMLYKDQEVWSKLETLQLTQMVKGVERGAFLAVGTRRMNLGDIYQRISEQEEKQQLAEESVITYDEVFQIFIALALVLLVVMIMMPHATTRRIKKSAVMASLLVLACLQTVESAQEEVADRAFDDGQYRQALEIYESLSTKTDDARLLYKIGNTQYRLAYYQDAAMSYQKALKHQPDGMLIRDITFNLGNAYFKDSKNVDDLYASLSLVNQSVQMFRRVVLQYPDDHAAAVNLELAKVERRKLQLEIAEEEKRRKEMAEALARLREQIEQLIAGQEENLKSTDEFLMAERPNAAFLSTLEEKETLIQEHTMDSIEYAESINARFFKDLPPEVSPLSSTKALLTKARGYESTAIEFMQQHTHDAYAEEELALEKLRKALEDLPRDSDSTARQEGEDGDDDADSEGDEGENEGENGDQTSDGEGEQEGDSQSMDATKMNLDAINLPPPNDSPEDVIKKNAVMQKARQSEGGKKQTKPVEKDW